MAHSKMSDNLFQKILDKLNEHEDDSGRLLKDSTLRWIIDEAINLAIQGRIVVHPEDFRIWRDWIENDPKELYRCWDRLSPGCLDTEAEEDNSPV